MGSSIKTVHDLEISDLLENIATASNQTSGNQQTKIKETSPVDSTKTNPIYFLTYTGDLLTQIDMKIGDIFYRKTLSYTNGKLTSVSAWQEV